MLIFILSFVSTCIAALALPGLYLTFRRHLDETSSVIALLALAWFPNFLPILGRVTNDALAFPLVVWAIYFCLRSRDSNSRLYIVLAGAAIMVAAFTKAYALTLWPLYIACAFFGNGRMRWREAGLALLAGAGGTGILLAFNLATTGHAIPLQHMVAAESIPLLERLTWLFKLNPVWFFEGLAKGFWWSGYWSFVSPGLIYYAPIGLLAWLLFLRCRMAWAAVLRSIWPHLVAVAAFVAAMAWHAANFALLANLRGQTEFSGNEGWYANVLVSSFAAIALVLLRARLAPLALRRILAGTAVFLVGWNIFSRVALGAFWMGLTDVEGHNRGIIWTQAMPSILIPDAWRNWLGLPGVVRPVAATSLLPLVMAIGLTAGILLRKRPGWHNPNFRDQTP